MAYVIRAGLSVRPGVNEPAAKFRDQFRRRVENGRCFATPYLGCREFSAYFGPPDGTERPIVNSDELGRMLFDLDYAADGSGKATPRFFDAKLNSGIMRIPTMEA